MKPTTVFFDLETGGLELTDSIIQLAAVAYDDATGNELGVFNELLQFDADTANPEALRKAHYDPVRWANDALPPLTVAQKFEAFLQPYRCHPMFSKKIGKYHVARLVAHNAPFDSERLDLLFSRFGIFKPYHLRIRCTEQRALWLAYEYPELPHPVSLSLESLCHIFQIPVNPSTTHDALVDVRLTHELYLKLKSVETDLIQCRQSSIAGPSTSLSQTV